jgi:hypothetical protein
MLKQLGLGTVLGAIVLFVWSFIAWTFIPWPGQPLRSFTNEDAIAAAIKANAPQSGNYLMPTEVKRTSGMTDAQYQKAQQDAMNRMMQGPMIFASIRIEPMGSLVKYFVMGFITDLVIALIASVLVLQTTMLSYACRVAFYAGIGLVIFAGGHLDEWNWWGFSNAYMAMQFGVLIIGWFLAGLVMAIFVRGKMPSV